MWKKNRSPTRFYCRWFHLLCLTRHTCQDNCSGSICAYFILLMKYQVEELFLSNLFSFYMNSSYTYNNCVLTLFMCSSTLQKYIMYNSAFMKPLRENDSIWILVKLISGCIIRLTRTYVFSHSFSCTTPSQSFYKLMPFQAPSFAIDSRQIIFQLIHRKLDTDKYTSLASKKECPWMRFNEGSAQYGQFPKYFVTVPECCYL